MGQENSLVSDGTPPQSLSERSLDGVAEYIKSGKARRIVCMVGAGISTSAGIPDFRSPDTGLYANLARLNLPRPEAVFDLEFFAENPKPFYTLAKELYPGNFHPTITHAFMRVLEKKGLLYQLFSQNIDGLERAAGVSPDLIVEAHGSFADQHCIRCKAPFPADKMREHVDRAEPPHCVSDGCGGLVKPDIVFFEEALPERFKRSQYMTDDADLVIVMGTSLEVYPFSDLPEMAKPGVPRVLFNLQRVGSFGQRDNDVIEIARCDDGVRKLADALGWLDELESEWRERVGPDEAQKQMHGETARDQELEEEVARLAEGIERAVHIDGDDGDANPENVPSPARHTTRESEGDQEAAEKSGGEQKNTEKVGDQGGKADQDGPAIPAVAFPVGRATSVGEEEGQTGAEGGLKD